MVRQRLRGSEGDGGGGGGPTTSAHKRPGNPGKGAKGQDGSGSFKGSLGKLAVVVVVGIVAFLGYQGYLETRIYTPLNAPKAVINSGLSVPERFWGSYRSDHSCGFYVCFHFGNYKKKSFLRLGASPIPKKANKRKEC